MTTQIDGFLKAAAEPTRLRILNLLRLGSVCVCDIQAILGLPQPAVSRHLALLRHVGLVLDRRQGNRILYSLAPATTPQMEALHRLVESCSTCEESLQNDLRMLDEALQHGQCAVSEFREKETMAS
jgi:ArsR family transcriptional regulator